MEDSDLSGDRLDLHLGGLALERGLITQDQLRAALADQAREAESGEAAGLLGFILVTRGYLTEEQLDSLLEVQKSFIMSSPHVQKVVDSAPLAAAPKSAPPLPRQAEPAPAAAVKKDGKTLGKYLLLREVGRGGMGVVYESIDTQLSRRVALKLLLSSMNADRKESAMDEERFLREARLSATLKHPHIVSVYETGIIEGKRYIAMEFVQGRQMNSWRKLGSVTIRQQVMLLRDIALAVQYAHTNGIIHRDLKPANVLVDGKKQPHVADFGLAKTSREQTNISLTASGMIMGTPAYMSPEQAKGKKSIDRRTDIYAMGAMLYEILTGRPPFKGDTPIEILMKVIYDPVPPPSTVLQGGAHPSLDPAIERICLKALAKNPNHRYPTAKGFADDLSKWLKGELIEMAPPSADPKKVILWTAVLTTAAVLLIALLFALFSSSAMDREFAKAERFMGEKMYEEAFEAFDKVVRKEPTRALAWQGKDEANRKIIAKLEAEAEQLLKEGKYSDANLAYSRAFARDLSNVRLQRKMMSLPNAAKEAAAQSVDQAERSRLEKQIREMEDAARSKKPGPVTPEEAKIPGKYDFIGKPTVEINLGVPRGEDGIRLVNLPDGPFETTTQAGHACVRPVPNPGGNQRLYFDIDDAWAARTAAARIEVEYFDSSPSDYFEVQYDSMTDTSSFSGAYQKGGSVSLHRTQTWKIARFTLEIPRFENRQWKVADFRIQASRGDLFVRRVSLRRLTGGEIAQPGLILQPVPVTPSALQQGWLAEYCTGRDFEKTAARKIDPKIDFEWPAGTGPEGLRQDFSIRWAGYLRVLRRDVYFFYAMSDDGVKVIVDGTPVISNWSTHVAETTLSGCELEEGYHSIVVEYFQGTGGAAIRFDCFQEQGAKMRSLGPEAFSHGPLNPPSTKNDPPTAASPPLQKLWRILLENRDKLAGQTVRIQKPGLGDTVHVIRGLSESQLLLDMKFGGGTVETKETPESLATAVLLQLVTRAVPRPTLDLLKTTAALLAERGDFDGAYKEFDKVKLAAPELREAARPIFVQERTKTDSLATTGEKVTALKKLLNSRSAYLPDNAKRALEKEISELVAPTPAGTILREWWTNIPGDQVADLIKHPAFKGDPSGTAYPALFEAPDNWADNYGQRMRGYVHAPATGFYTFWVSSDDGSELYVSTDDTPEKKRLIASQTWSVPRREWNRTPTQKSGPVSLTAGRRYYIEVLHKEGRVDDHLAVGWQLPDGSEERPIPGNRLSPFVTASSGVAPAVNPAPGLVGYWKFDDGKGVAAADSSGQGHTARLVNGPVWVQGKTGGLRFDGLSNYVELPNSPTLNKLQEGDYSMVAWFKPESDLPARNDKDMNQGIVIKIGWHEGLQYDDSRKFRMNHWLTGNSYQPAIHFRTEYPAGTYYSLAGTVDRSSGIVHFYVDGSLEASKEFAPNTPARDFGNAPWRVGAASDAQQSGWRAKGVISSVRLYNRALNVSEVEALFKAESAAHDR